jgi:hypothetical protein
MMHGLSMSGTVLLGDQTVMLELVGVRMRWLMILYEVQQVVFVIIAKTIVIALMTNVVSYTIIATQDRCFQEEEYVIPGSADLASHRAGRVPTVMAKFLMVFQVQCMEIRMGVCVGVIMIVVNVKAPTLVGLE